MEEHLDILDRHGNPLGESHPKSLVHQRGFYHNTVHIWFYTNQGEILLAQRSYKKSICPGLWDVSVAGHVDAGETMEEAAIREVSEEIGLSINHHSLKKIGVFECFQDYDFGVSDNEFHHTFLCKLTNTIDTLEPHPEEVESLKLVSFDEFRDLIKHIGKDNHFVPSNKLYYLKVISAIEEQIP